MNEDVRTGRCLCGKVRFTTHGPLRGVVYCHCPQCRRQTGHYYAATKVADAALSLEGAASITWYSASEGARRGFCATCGSALFWKREGDAGTSILAGAFDDPSGLVADCHIFVEAKGDYYEITDGLPQHARSTGDIPVAGG